MLVTAGWRKFSLRTFRATGLATKLRDKLEEKLPACVTAPSKNCGTLIYLTS